MESDLPLFQQGAQRHQDRSPHPSAVLRHQKLRVVLERHGHAIPMADTPGRQLRGETPGLFGQRTKRNGRLEMEHGHRLRPAPGPGLKRFEQRLVRQRDRRRNVSRIMCQPRMHRGERITAAGPPV